MTAGTQLDQDAPARTADPVDGPVGLVDGGDAWCLSDSVALRPEPFGALAYDFSTRQLSFLKTPTLVDVVRGLGEHDSVTAAIAAAGVAPAERAAYLSALDTLARTGIIKERAA